MAGDGQVVHLASLAVVKLLERHVAMSVNESLGDFAITVS